MSASIVVLPGDGIGPEITRAATGVLRAVAEVGSFAVSLEEAPFGGAAIDQGGIPAPPEVMAAAASSDAVLLGAVGGPKWDAIPPDRRPEKGLLQLRQHLGVYANLRPARFWPGLEHASPLRPELIKGCDVLVVRELLGGLYFGEPRGRSVEGGVRRGWNTQVYDEHEIRRIAVVAFEQARARSGRVASVDKANVLEVQRLWREVATEVGAEWPDVELEHLYVDSAAMRLATRPRSFDVIFTSNLFGDVLSDAAGALTGSLGMLPSASVGEGPGLYEPVHGSAPDIAGQDVANPIGTILSVAMMFRSAFERPDLADAIDTAVEQVLAEGLRTVDVYTGRPGERRVGTVELGEAVAAAATKLVRVAA